MLNDFYDDSFEKIINVEHCNKPIRALLHQHNKYEFIIVDKGESTVIMPDSVKFLHAPYIEFIPPFIEHEQINNTSMPYSRYFVQFDEKILNNSLVMPSKYIITELNHSESEILLDIVMLILKYCNKNDYSEIDMIRFKHMLLLLLNDLSPIVARHMPELTVPSKYSYIHDVCKYIKDNCGEQLSLDHISEHFFISRAKLTHDFKYVTQMTVTEYIATMRISNSKLLLKDGLSLEEIAERCGFSSSSYYITTFKNMTGMTPAQFRIKIKSMPFGNV